MSPLPRGSSLHRRPRFGHSTPKNAAAFAKDCGAAALILTHFSPRYPLTSHPDFSHQAVSVADMAHQARRRLGKGPHVLPAYDFMAVSIPRGGFGEDRR